jgi:hypothetical protein
MIIALLFLILFAILFPSAFRFLLAIAFLGAIVILGQAAHAQGFSQGCGNVPAHVCAGLESQAQYDARKQRDAEEEATTRRIENEVNTTEAAKKSEALSHIKDEDVLNFPARDVDASCSFDFHAQASINACVDHAQPYYNIGKLLWEGISLTGRKECLLMAEQYGKAYQFYVSLGSCLQVKETEADMKRHRTFNAW